MRLTDAELAALQQGDQLAIERLVAEYEGPLFRYFLAAHGDAALAGDQSADSFIELIRALPKMRGGPAALRSFVYAVARNVERRRWRGVRTGSVPLDDASETVCSAAGPAESAEQNEQLERTLSAILSLDTTTREIFLLRFVEQLPVVEVARTLDLPVGTVKSRIHRGREELKTMLAPSEEDA